MVILPIGNGSEEKLLEAAEKGLGKNHGNGARGSCHQKEGGVVGWF